MAEMSLEEYADQSGKGARLGKREGVKSMGGRRAEAQREAVRTPGVGLSWEEV